MKSEDFTIRCWITLAESILCRIKKNIAYDTNFKTYQKKTLKKMLSYYESIEEFESCIEIQRFIKNRFDHENNYLVK